MSKQLIHKQHNRDQRHRRVRAVVSGTTERPRLSVHVSNLHIVAQLVDDVKGQTMAYASSVGHKELKGSMTEKAEWVGTEIAKLAKTKKIKRVVFDRGGKIYHGRVAALAEAARKAGLEF
jgi:large subunit ribosomal protein L18